jgi:hypothetical protein
METSGPTAGISPPLAAATRGSAAQWQVGQLLLATVTERRAGNVLLAIGNRQISAETSLPLQKGQQLGLQVLSLGERPVLRLTASAGESPINSAIRRLLPKQGPLPPLLATMGQLVRNPGAPIPPLINELIRSIVKQMPDSKTAASARGLKKAVTVSGIFLERQLVQEPNRSAGPASIALDFKANLLRLVRLLHQWPRGTSRSTANLPHSTSAASATGTAPASAEQIRRTAQAGVGGKSAAGAASSLSAGALAPPLRGSIPVAQPAIQSKLEPLNRVADFRADLLQQAEAALARIQLHQLAALPREGERGLLEWLLELPIRRGDDIDLWSIRISDEHRQQPQESRQQTGNWSVQLAFDLPGLGPIQAQVQLAGEQVSTRFWAEHQDTLPLLRQHLHELRQALNEAGLDVGDLECQPGPRAVAKPTGNRALINEKA